MGAHTDRYVSHINLFSHRFRAELRAKLAFKQRLEADSSFKIPARIWFAFLTPPNTEAWKKIPSKCVDVIKLKKMMLDTFEDPARFLQMKNRSRRVNECVTLSLLETLFDLEGSKVLLDRARYDTWIEIAEEFGLWKIRYALEDMVFKAYEPDTYDAFRSVVEKQIHMDQEKVRAIRAIIKNAITRAGIKRYSIVNREKNIYGVYQKIEKKGLSINRIFDIHGFRILVGSKEDCYRTFEVINALWPHFRDRFKDYIAHPKPNGYQSIHTVFSAIEKRAIEFQIRTYEMDAIAESGQANHAEYKRSMGGRRL